MYLATVGKRLLVILGSDPAILESSVASAEGNTSELANNAVIAGVKEQIVPGAMVVSYVSVPRLFALMQSAMMPGGPAAPAAPASPPVVMSAGVSGSTLTMELHIPTTTITTIKDMIPRMMRGLPPGGPGGGDGMQP